MNGHRVARWRCVSCGLRLRGRLLPARGVIVADDRTVPTDQTERPCTCTACHVGRTAQRILDEGAALTGQA